MIESLLARRTGDGPFGTGSGVAMRAGVLVALNLLMTAALADEPMRCGSGFISSSSTVAELLAKCGEPDEKQSRVEDVRHAGAAGGMVKSGTTRIETWIYRSSSQVLPRVVTIVDGKIKRIETKS